MPRQWTLKQATKLALQGRTLSYANATDRALIWAILRGDVATILAHSGGESMTADSPSIRGTWLRLQSCSPSGHSPSTR